MADIPKWITDTIEKSEIDLATYDRFNLSTTEALLKHFDENIEGAKRALMNITYDQFGEPFYLRNAAQVLYTASKKDSIRSTLNHWVHHRGQLTVYMRLNNIPVPSIYGPSADERSF